MPAQFIHNEFLLHGNTSRELYHTYAENLPVIDYHNHLSPSKIAADHSFNNITALWLDGDHYKWRAMRANGIPEKRITANNDPLDCFKAWAETVPYTVANPLFHWTHLELKRYFNWEGWLNKETAGEVYNHCNALLAQKNFSTRGLLQMANVEIVCTTDDPADSLEYHEQLKAHKGFAVYPTFRTDAAFAIHRPDYFSAYLNRLEEISDSNINSFDDLLSVLKQRHDDFEACGCHVADFGLATMCSSSFTHREASGTFNKWRNGQAITPEEVVVFQSCLLMIMAGWNAEKNWVQQFHLGAIRNNSSRLEKLLGGDAGSDSIGDFTHAASLAAFLNQLDCSGKLAKTILYNSNPADNALFATMAGNYNDGSVAGKIQWGSAWWFLDCKTGIEEQLAVLGSMGLLSRFVGMVTDSRSFLSFPRHEYFRRLLCNYLGNGIDKGELPNDVKWIGSMVQDICYHNTKRYFNWEG